jgi:hypothetical protein
MVLGWWVRLAVRVGIGCRVLMGIRRGSGERELRLSVSARPFAIILCSGLRLKLGIIKRRSSADHVRWGMSRISRTGMVRMTFGGIRGGRGVGGRGRIGREPIVSRLGRGSR